MSLDEQDFGPRERGDSLERWQGRVEAQASNASTRATEQGAAIQEVKNLVVSLQIEVATLKTKIGFFGLIGGVVGSGAVSLAVTLLGAHH